MNILEKSPWDKYFHSLFFYWINSWGYYTDKIALANLVCILPHHFSFLGFLSTGFWGIYTMISAYLIWKRGILAEACFVSMPWLSEQSCGEHANLVIFFRVCNVPRTSEILLCTNVCFSMLWTIWDDKHKLKERFSFSRIYYVIIAQGHFICSC